METLTPDQIQNWRKIIAMQLNARFEGSGIYALVMPESEVIAYWQRMKAIIEKSVEIENNKPSLKLRAKCDHRNSFTGNNGTYCIDCEKYV